MEVIIPKNSPIPTKKSQIFSNSEDFQSGALIEVYEGESRKIKDCVKLGSFLLD
jgi:molecular chaperone DnaK (HSP70)